MWKFGKRVCDIETFLAVGMMTWIAGCFRDGITVGFRKLGNELKMFGAAFSLSSHRPAMSRFLKSCGVKSKCAEQSWAALVTVNPSRAISLAHWCVSPGETKRRARIYQGGFKILNHFSVRCCLNVNLKESCPSARWQCKILLVHGPCRDFGTASS